MNWRRSFSWLVAAACLGWASTVAAEVKLPSIFGTAMVLQRDMPVPVWGTAAAGEDVKVTFAGQEKTAKAGTDGKWSVSLGKLTASAEGKSLVIAGSNTITLENVLVGEVWICSGQSNMEWGINGSLNADEMVKNATNPQIRAFNVGAHVTHALPQSDCPGAWRTCVPTHVAGFSAVGYFFGKRLQAELNVPVGLVQTAWGGTRIEPWISLQGFQSVPELKAQADEVAARDEKAKKKEAVSIDHNKPSAIYNAMIHPLVPFAARGAIWYQGESNGNEGEEYFHKMTALINGWRKDFNPDLAFYFVQLANFTQPNEDPAGGNEWAKLREAQRKTLTLPNTGMAVIIDIGEAGDIHPKNKQDVGWRLAQWALHQTYGKKNLVPSGPLYKGIEAKDGAIRLSFDNVGGGLMVGKKEGLNPTVAVPDGKLARFAIAGEDKKWFWADAVIEGNRVVVKSKGVANPVAVRYGYQTNPTGANLYNKEGMPASPFRSDNW